MIVEYLRSKMLEGFSKETLSNYRLTINRFLTSVKKSVEDITSNDIRAYFCQYQNLRGVTIRSLDKIRMMIAGLFHWASAEGRTENDPSLAIKTSKYTVKPKPNAD